MKRNFLFHVLLLSGLIAISITGFTGCFYENAKDASHISETELEQLADDADAVVKAYFKEKYDVQAAVTDRSIAGGVFLGPDPSAEPYYNCTVSITDDEDYTACNAEVYGKRADKEIELYVKNESYYGKFINDTVDRTIYPASRFAGSYHRVQLYGAVLSVRIFCRSYGGYICFIHFKRQEISRLFSVDDFRIRVYAA